MTKNHDGSSSEPEDEGLFPAIDHEKIKLHPDELKNELEESIRASRPARSIVELQKMKAIHLEQKIANIFKLHYRPTEKELTSALGNSSVVHKEEDIAPLNTSELSDIRERSSRNDYILSEKYRVVFRVCGDKNQDFQSEAEKRAITRYYTEDEKNKLCGWHANKNRKEAEGLYSPFVSTTSDIRALVATTFSYGPAGDPSLRNEVFENAEYLHILTVPTERCTEVLQGSGYPEKEVLYDTSNATSYTSSKKLIDRIVAVYDNQFNGSVVVDLTRLAKSRGQHESMVERLDQALFAQTEVSALNSQPINPEILSIYEKWFTLQKHLCEELTRMPKIQTPSKAPVETRAAVPREPKFSRVVFAEIATDNPTLLKQHVFDPNTFMKRHLPHDPSTNPSHTPTNTQQHQSVQKGGVSF